MRATRLLICIAVLIAPARALAQGPRPEVAATADALMLAVRDSAFRANQLSSQRVIGALIDTKLSLKDQFRKRGLAYPGAGIYLRAFKREHQLELWVQPKPGEKYVLLKTYEICSISGKLGPKRAQGDEQTPEGFYHIDDFNPRSGYHLSLHINYPNEADRLRGAKGAALGSDIFIHGGCRTVGCLPVTDAAIKEIYWLSLETRFNGNPIPVHIFPTRLTPASYTQLVRHVPNKDGVLAFWLDLKRGYDYFELTHNLPKIAVDPIGRYRISAPAPVIPVQPFVGMGD